MIHVHKIDSLILRRRDAGLREIRRRRWKFATFIVCVLKLLRLNLQGKLLVGVKSRFGVKAKFGLPSAVCTLLRGA